MIQTIIFDGDKAKVERDMNTWLERMQSDSKIKFEIKDIKFIKSEDYKHGYHGVRYAAMVIYDSSELENSTKDDSKPTGDCPWERPFHSPDPGIGQW